MTWTSVGDAFADESSVQRGHTTYELRMCGRSCDEHLYQRPFAPIGPRVPGVATFKDVAPSSAVEQWHA